MIKNKDYTKGCQQCGACCHMQIPLTILDIHRIAEYKGKPDKEIFKRIIGKISNKFELFLITKAGQHRACIFLDDKERCEIHLAKPNVCRFYQCSHHNKGIDWTAYYRDISQSAKLWEQSIAAKITSKYIEKNSSVWNEKDYFNALESIRENIKSRENQKLKLGFTSNGSSVPMLYNCSKCDKRGECAEATPITLDDCQRIAKFMGVSGQEFFAKYISREKCLATGGLKLKEKEHCILFNKQEEKCNVEEVKPLHCRFTTCPLSTKDSKTKEILHLGSGTIKGQFRHQVALQITREYVSQSGVNYNAEMISYFLQQLENIITNPKNRKEFMNEIAKYRYVNDTWEVNNNE